MNCLLAMFFAASTLLAFATSVLVASAALSPRRLVVDLAKRATCAPDLSNGSHFNIQLVSASGYSMGSTDCEACHTEGLYATGSSEDIFQVVESPTGAAAGNFRIHPIDYGSFALQSDLEDDLAEVSREIAPATFDATFDSWSIECNACNTDAIALGTSCQVLVIDEAQNLRQCLTSDGVSGVGTTHLTLGACGDIGLADQTWNIVYTDADPL